LIEKGPRQRDAPWFIIFPAVRKMIGKPGKFLSARIGGNGWE